MLESPAPLLSSEIFGAVIRSIAKTDEINGISSAKDVNIGSAGACFYTKKYSGDCMVLLATGGMTVN